jgi:cytochrome c oxidase subunit 1
MYASATPPWMRMFFMVTTMLVAVPSGIKVFGWVATVWGGKIRFTTPMLFALGGISNWLFAGITGIFLGSVPIDLHVHNTYFVVGHFHYVLYGAIVMGIFGAIYHWFPKMTGRMYYEGLGKLHFALTYIGTALIFLPMHPLGLMGMPRRVASYDPEFAFWNVIASIGGFLLGLSTLPFILNMVSSWISGEKVGNNPWRAYGLEWLTSSPPAVENFEELPIVVSGPYGYGSNQPLVANIPNPGLTQFTEALPQQEQTSG